MLNSFKWKNVRCKIFVGKPKRKVQRKCNSEKWKEKREFSSTPRLIAVWKCWPPLSSQSKTKTKKCQHLTKCVRTYRYLGNWARIQIHVRMHGCVLILAYRRTSNICTATNSTKKAKKLFLRRQIIVYACIYVCVPRGDLWSADKIKAYSRKLFICCYDNSIVSVIHMHTHTHTRQLNSKGAWITWGEVLTLTYQSPTAQVIGLTGTFSENAHTCSHSHAHTQTQRGA